MIKRRWLRTFTHEAGDNNMRHDKEFSELIGSVYDCALDKNRWPETLGQICDAMDGMFADLSVLNTMTGAFEIMALHKWPTEFLEITRANMHSSPFIALGLVMPLAEPFCVSRDYGLEEMRRTPYWKRVIQGHGTGDLIIIPLKRTVANLAYLGVTASEARGEFSDRHIGLARLLAPHIQRSIHISGVIEHRKLVESTLRDVLETLAAAAFILRADGAVIYRNQQAAVYLSDGNFVKEINHRLVGTNPTMTEFLVSGFGRDNSCSRASDIYLDGRDGQSLHATRLRLAEDGFNASSLLLLRSPEPELRTPIQAATKLFTLTVREAQILAQLLHGQSLQEIGEFLGVARSTVKMHLDSIYAKTRTSRQSDLVKTVMALAPTLRS